MNNLSVFAFDGDRIRQTEDGRYSVFDIIQVLGGQKNPRQTWTGDSRGNGLVVKFPEVVTKVDNFKFPGRGQRETPVTDKEGLQQAQKSGLVKRDIKGGKDCYNVCKEAAAELKSFLNKWLS